MSKKLEVSFNSPQCGWMSVGFSVGEKEYHTTTAYAPHEDALSNLLRGLTSLAEANSAKDEFVVLWSRNPEAYDFQFDRENGKVKITLIEYPTFERIEDQGEKVFSYEGETREICEAFYETFEQLYAERFEDEFEENWHQPFPLEEFEKFKQTLDQN